MMVITFARKACENSYVGQRHSNKKFVYVEGRIAENTVYVRDNILMNTGNKRKVCKSKGNLSIRNVP